MVEENAKVKTWEEVEAWEGVGARAWEDVEAVLEF